MNHELMMKQCNDACFKDQAVIFGLRMQQCNEPWIKDGAEQGPWINDSTML